jgi:hypothetical protein
LNKILGIQRFKVNVESDFSSIFLRIFLSASHTICARATSDPRGSARVFNTALHIDRNVARRSHGINTVKKRRDLPFPTPRFYSPLKETFFRRIR